MTNSLPKLFTACVFTAALAAIPACGSAEVGEVGDEQPFVDTAEDVSEGEQAVNEKGECCWYRCKNDGNPGWYGPLTDISSHCNYNGWFGCDFMNFEFKDSKWGTCNPNATAP